MKKVGEVEATVHKETWELDDPVMSNGQKFDTWSRVWTEGEEDAKWTPVDVSGEPMDELSVEVVQGSKNFVLESRRNMALYGSEVGESVTQKRAVTASQCQYVEPWKGKCGNDAVSGSDYCEDHHGKTCFACDSQATGGCSHAGSLVCGVPECDDHSHH